MAVLCLAAALLPRAMAQPRFAMPLPRTLRSASLRRCSALVAMPSPADGVLCPCLPMPCTALAMRAFAVPCRRFATLANALAMPSSPRKAAARNRHAPAQHRLALPSHRFAFHAPAYQRPAIAARRAPCSCGSMRRPAPQPRICASPPPCRAFDALPPPNSALLCNAVAVRRNPQPLLCQSSP